MGKLFVYLFTLFPPLGKDSLLSLLDYFRNEILIIIFFVLDDHIAYVILLCKANP